MGGQLIAVLDTELPDRKTGVEKIEFGCLDQTFVEISVMWRQQMHDITGFQYGYPGFGCVVRNAAVIGEGGKVEELPFRKPRGSLSAKSRWSRSSSDT